MSEREKEKQKEAKRRIRLSVIIERISAASKMKSMQGVDISEPLLEKLEESWSLSEQSEVVGGALEQLEEALGIGRSSTV